MDGELELKLIWTIEGNNRVKIILAAKDFFQLSAFGI
jgi:hypothetical protein